MTLEAQNENNVHNELFETTFNSQCYHYKATMCSECIVSILSTGFQHKMKFWNDTKIYKSLLYQQNAPFGKFIFSLKFYEIFQDIIKKFQGFPGLQKFSRPLQTLFWGTVQSLVTRDTLPCKILGLTFGFIFQGSKQNALPPFQSQEMNAKVQNPKILWGH